MNSNQIQWTMDAALRAIPGFQEVAYRRFHEARPNTAIEKTQLWLNCEGVKPSPHPVWRKKHSWSCKGVVLVVRDLTVDPNAPDAIWSTLLVADRFYVMSGLTPPMGRALGALHHQYAVADLADLCEAQKLERELGL